MALDVGDKRIGVAVANVVAKLPRPLTTLENKSSIWEDLHQLIQQESVSEVVIGIPRGLEGQVTEQTRKVEEFVGSLKSEIKLPVHVQDEALTSVKAEEELSLKKVPHSKSAVDALAATYILEDFLRRRYKL